MLKTLRKQKRLTQKELGDLCGLRQNYISNFETKPAECNPTVNALMALSSALEIESEKLFMYFVKNKMD